jgi:hypothetical protein
MKTMAQRGASPLHRGVAITAGAAGPVRLGEVLCKAGEALVVMFSYPTG